VIEKVGKCFLVVVVLVGWIKLYPNNKTEHGQDRQVDRSAATACAQIHTHDKFIEKTGCCVECRRLKGTYENEKAKIKRRSA